MRPCGQALDHGMNFEMVNVTSRKYFPRQGYCLSSFLLAGIRRATHSSPRKGFPGGSDGKESTSNVGDLGLIPGLGRSPGGGHGNPLQYSCLENPHEQRSLTGYSPWGGKESDMTKRLSTAPMLSIRIGSEEKFTT